MGAASELYKIISWNPLHAVNHIRLNILTRSICVLDERPSIISLPTCTHSLDSGCRLVNACNEELKKSSQNVLLMSSGVMASNWCTIESDPGVFSELISTIGVKDVQVEELYAMDKESMDALKPVHGLIFLFKWQKDPADASRNVADAPNVFFARQVISNACATQAILSVLMNRPEVDLGPELSQFKEFAKDLPAEMRGLAIGNSQVIRSAHNSFARPEPIVFDSKAATEDDDVFHFIGYVPVGGRLYELDGLQDGPIDLGECKEEDWLDKARPAIQQRIEKYSAKEIRFNLLALVKDRKKVLAEKISAIGNPDSAESKQFQRDLEAEEEKRKNWKDENVRRRHNYIPFVFELLKQLASKDKLNGLVATAKESVNSRAESGAKKEMRSGD